MVVLEQERNVPMAHILIVCTANICRSPLVEAMLRRSLHEDPSRADWTVSSAGTWAQFERGAARYSQKIGKRIDLDLSEHVAKMITADMVAEADLVLVMTSNHKEGIQYDREFREHAHKVFLMSEMIERSYDVVDPYGGPADGYEDMYREVDMLLSKGFDRIVKIASENQAARATA